MKNLFLVLTLLTGSLASANSEVEKAHESYVDGKYLEMTTHMKQALMDEPDNRQVRDNLMKLLSKAHEERHGMAMPTDWNLPNELDHFKFEVKRNYDANLDRTRYHLQFVTHLKEKGVLEQLQVVRYPNEVLFDKQAGVGEWAEELWDGKDHGFWGSSQRVSKPFPDGLYLLNIKVKDKPMVQGWVLLEQMDAQTSPVIESPTYAQTFQTATPTFRWKSYRSPFYKPSEKVKVRFSVSKDEAPYSEVIEAGLKNPATLEYTVGTRDTLDDFEGVTKFEPGNYWFMISFQERRNFGDIILSRASASRASFSVR